MITKRKRIFSLMMALGMTTASCMIPWPQGDSMQAIAEDTTIATTWDGSEINILNIFPDENLARVVANTVGKSGDLNTITVTQVDLDSIFTLYATGFAVTNDQDKIEDITGINYLNNLEKLYLYFNKISSLVDSNDVSVFQGLANLKELHLNFNKISSLVDSNDVSVFQGLANLQYLYLNHNSISSLHGNVFNKLSNLQNLSLNDNQISSLPENVFQGLTNLQKLYLSNNQISSIETNAFNGLDNLQKLYVDAILYDQISEINHNVILPYSVDKTTYTLAELGLPDTIVIDMSYLTNCTYDVASKIFTVNDINQSFSFKFGSSYQVEVYQNNQLIMSKTITHTATFSFAEQTSSLSELFTDANLRLAVAKTLGVGEGAQVTKSQLAGINELNASELGITNEALTDFVAELTKSDSPLTGLTSLNLDKNNISDLTPLSLLLTKISVSVADQNIEYAATRKPNGSTYTLSDFGIVGAINPDGSLVPFTVTLSSDSNCTYTNGVFTVLNPSMPVNFSFSQPGFSGKVVVSLKAPDLSLSMLFPNDKLRNKIVDKLREMGYDPSTMSPAQLIDALAQITTLSAPNANISSLAGMQWLTGLVSLNLNKNLISDVTSLAGLTNLKVLHLSFNNISDTSPLSSIIPKLTVFKI